MAMSRLDLHYQMIAEDREQTRLALIAERENPERAAEMALALAEMPPLVGFCFPSKSMVPAMAQAVPRPSTSSNSAPIPPLPPPPVPSGLTVPPASGTSPLPGPTTSAPTASANPSTSTSTSFAPAPAAPSPVTLRPPRPRAPRRAWTPVEDRLLSNLFPHLPSLPGLVPAVLDSTASAHAAVVFDKLKGGGRSKAQCCARWGKLRKKKEGEEERGELFMSFKEVQTRDYLRFNPPISAPPSSSSSSSISHPTPTHLLPAHPAPAPAPPVVPATLKRSLPDSSHAHSHAHDEQDEASMHASKRSRSTSHPPPLSSSSFSQAYPAAASPSAPGPSECPPLLPLQPIGAPGGNPHDVDVVAMFRALKAAGAVGTARGAGAGAVAPNGAAVQVLNDDLASHGVRVPKARTKTKTKTKAKAKATVQERLDAFEGLDGALAALRRFADLFP